MTWEKDIYKLCLGVRRLCWPETIHLKLNTGVTVQQMNYDKK